MKSTIKRTLGTLPYTAELYWWLRQSHRPPVGGYALERLRDSLPDWVAQARRFQRPAGGKRLTVVTMLPYWVEQTALTGLALAALGHEVTLAYLPYAHWKRPVERFDLRRQNLYLREILAPLDEMLTVLPLLDAPQARSLPDALAAQLPAATYRDVQYSLLREDVDTGSDLYRLRMARNREQARRLFRLWEAQPPDGIIVPNGSILEFGITFRVARHLGIPIVTYEFGEQSGRIWLAQNDDVMRQDTSDLWDARRDVPLTEEEWALVRELFAARQGGGIWKTFSRRWQGTPSQGAEAARAALGLDSRPMVLLPTNVLGDSLTLGRQVFSESMTEWLVRTIEYFRQRGDAQLVIRVHPGESGSWGPSVYDILREKFPDLPEHIHLLPADAKINTYDLVAAADAGLVFTTTVGMEMAMSGLPVIVTGWTHYRGKGFTLDAESWDSYFELLDGVLESPEKYHPSRNQVESAWTYAYRFFMEYPQPFPWHVQHLAEDTRRWPPERVLSDEGLAQFGRTFGYLAGEPMWRDEADE